jgi:hypothetical protein
MTVQNNVRGSIVIPDVYTGIAGIRNAEPHEHGASKVIAFCPTRPLRKPEKAAQVMIDGRKHSILRIERSAASRGFYVAYVVEAE